MATPTTMAIGPQVICATITPTPDLCIITAITLVLIIISLGAGSAIKATAVPRSVIAHDTVGRENVEHIVIIARGGLLWHLQLD